MLPQTERKMRKWTFQPKTTCICRENMVRISEYNSPSKYNKIYKRCVGWLVVWLVIFFFNRTHMKKGYVSDEKSSQNKRWKRKKFRWIFFLIFFKAWSSGWRRCANCESISTRKCANCWANAKKEGRLKVFPFRKDFLRREISLKHSQNDKKGRKRKHEKKQVKPNKVYRKEGEGW